MRTRFFIVSIFIILILIFIISSSIIISESSSESSPPPLSVDKKVYEVEETVLININIDPSKYGLYDLLISATNNSYTYKGDFNPVMFFYPTEEGIYTIALVEKSTRAVFYSLSFNVTPKNESVLEEVPRENITEREVEEIEEVQVNESYINISVNGSYPGKGTERILGEKSILLEKSDFLPGEKVRVFFSNDVLKEPDKFRLYHVFKGSKKRYMGDLGFIEFVPSGFGVHELVLTDSKNNIINTTGFRVVLPLAQRIVRVINNKGVSMDVKALLFDENGRIISINDSIEVKNKTYSLRLTPNQAVFKSLKELVFNNLRFSDEQISELRIGLEDIPVEEVRIKNKRIMKAFAINPIGLNFSNGTATATAMGAELWKCKDWVFEAQLCMGEWEKVMDLTPGQEYSIIITPEDPGYAETGVASINTKKPVYHPYEAAEIIIVVLDREGQLVSNTDVILNITNPAWQTTTLTTRAGGIVEKERGVYKTTYNNTALEGNYSLLVRAVGDDVNSTIRSYFAVRSYYEFDILREAPVTTDPWIGAFDSSIKIVSYINISRFNFTEVLPDNFTITNQGGAIIRDADGKIYLTWTGLNNNSVVRYSARPPLITPELYKLGPAYIEYPFNYSLITYYEARPWYLAVDPTSYYDPNSNVQQGWDDGTGTGYTEVDDGIRQPDTSNITDDYISARANDNTYAEFGFPNITQNPINITFWIYAGSSNCGFLAYLQQGGTTQCTIDVNPGTSNNWFSCTWTNPSGGYDNMSIEFYQDSKDAGAPGYCYVYGAYLEVSYNNPPNVTNLTYPVNKANLSSRINIDFNFTVTDQETPISNCTLWANFSGIWSANKTVYNVANNTETNITITVPEGSFVWNIYCTDSGGLSDFYESNYSLRVDTTYPTISYSSGTEENNTYLNRNWVYVNVTANDTNEKNITFRLYNTTGIVNITTYTDQIHEVNFTNLDSNMQYWYNVSVCDQFGWCNTTETRKITLDSTHPSISYSSGTEGNNTYLNRNWVYVNVTANDTNEKNITFRLYNTTGIVNTTTYTTPIREINFTNLNPNMQYWYNVTITDKAGNKNTTKTYKITLDSIPPDIAYSTGVEPNNTYSNRNWVYVNVTANDTNEKNITFRLYNTTGIVNTTTYTTPIREINFTNLNPNMQYWYNVTITDKAGFENSTVTYKITLDSTHPNINLEAPGDDTFTNNEFVQFNYTPIDTYLDVCILYGNFTGPFNPNETDNNPINGSINTLGPLNLSDGRYIWNVWCNDSAGNTNFSQYNYTVKVDTQKPIISNWKTNGTIFLIYEYICLNVTVTDNLAGVDTVYAEIEDPNGDVENITLTDDGSSCDAAEGDDVYSKSYYLEFGGNYTWLNTYANDSAENWQINITNLNWNASSYGSMTVNMTSPTSDLEINESEYNYQYQQNCSVKCDAGGSDCINVTLFAEYNPGVFQAVTTTTTDLVNDEDNFSCGNLIAGGSACTHTFNITSGSDSGNNTWLIRCSATSSNIGSFVSSAVNLTINDHPYASFTHPQNNTWLGGVEMLNASASYDSDGSISNYLFEYDNNTAFTSPGTLCNSASSNCTWNTSQQEQCENNSMSCYLRVSVKDDDGLTNSTYILLGIDNQGPATTLDMPRNYENITTNTFTANASVNDGESGVDTVIFEYRQNNTDTWKFACNDNRGPVYDCDWDTSNLPDGNSYEFRAYANDSKGNSGNYDVHTNITIDRTGPVVNLEAPEDDGNLTYSLVTFYYNASDALSSLKNCSLIIDGSIINTTDNPTEGTTLNFTYNLSDGSYNWSINCTDSLSNENASEIRRINIDSQGPVSILDRPPNSSILTGATVTINASVSDSGFAQVDTATFEYRRNSTTQWNLICKDNRDPVYDCTWDTTVLPDGDEYEIRVYANDSFGNIGNIDTHINITIDNNAPNITLISPPDDSIDTDGDLVFLYQVRDVSPIRNCSLIINNDINQTNSSVKKGENQYFYLYGVEDGTQLNWSINCTDYINLTNRSETRNITVNLNANMNLTLEMDKKTYYAGETAIITNNVTDAGNNPVSGADISTAIVLANTTIPWWNSSWQRRKPITLSSPQTLTNVVVEVNITGLDNYISSCDNEIRIVRFNSNNELYSVNRTVVQGDDSTYCTVWFKANITAGVNNTEFMAYYNNSVANNPNNNVTRATQNTTKTSISGSILGLEYDVTDGSSSDTTTDNGVYYAVGRDNSPPTGQPLNAYINLSYNLSDIGVPESDLVSLNFTINYCHSNDITPPITCGGAIGAGTPAPAYVELYDFDSSSWATGFDTITQDVNSSAENTETYVETSNLGNYVDDTSSVLWVRYETDIGGLTKNDDASFALDYATLNVFYKEQAVTGLGSIGSTETLIVTNSSVTDYQGVWVWDWGTSGVQAGNYSAISLAKKTGYNNAYDYYWFKIEIDSTGPVSTLDRPPSNSVIDTLNNGYYYMVNASVTDSGVGNISTVTFMYRYNSSDTWKLICRDNDGTAPYNCTWDLTSLSNGYDYEVRVYANDSLGNTGANDTHINITIITEPINITLIIVDDPVPIPVDEVDLKAGTIRIINCNITIQDPEVYTNIEGVNATLYSSTTSYGVADNNRTHYTNSSCSFLTGGGQSADYQCVFRVWYYAINGTWNCTAFTWNNYSTDNATDNTTINQLFALNISTSVIDYTTLEPNQTSPNVTVNISNVGNMPMNISVYGFGGEDEATGTDLSMVCEINNISVSFERYSTNNTDDYNSKNQLSSSPQDIGLTIPPKTSPNEVRVNSTYWQFMVPPESHTLGQCNGSVVFVASMP